MAENEKEVNEQTDEAKAKLLDKSKVYPNYTAVQDFPQQYQENQEINQSGDQSDTKLYQSINNQIKRKKYTIDNETEQNLYSIIAINTFQMRRRVLDMETNILKTYFIKQFIDNENDTWKNINKIEMYLGGRDTVPEINNFVQAEYELLIVENLSAALMNKIRRVLYTKAVEKEVVRGPEHNIQVPDYRSIVTVRGTEEDVKNCILKATAALESGKYDRAEILLLKADRIFPTKNAMDLLKEVQSAKIQKQNPNIIENVTKSAGHLYTIKNEELQSEIDSDNAAKCLTAFEKAFTHSKFVKAERLLHKAKRFNPSLDVEENMSRVKVAIADNIKKEKLMIEKANGGLKIVEDYHYKTGKTYDTRDFRAIERNLKEFKTFYSYLESLDSRNSTDEKPKMTKSDQPIMNTSFEDQVYSLEKNNNNTLIRPEYDSNRDNSNKDDKKESTNKNKLLHDRNLEHTNFLGNFEGANRERSNYSFKYNIDSKTTKLPPKNQTDFMYTAENESNDKKIKNHTNFPNTAEKFKPTPLVKDRLEMVNDIGLSREKNEYSNSYKFPVEENESNEIEASKCTKMAEEASQKGQYDRAERLLLKSLRICYTKTASSNLERVRNAKAQNDKTTKLPPKNQADFMYTAENDSKNKKIENPTNFPNTAEKFKPTPLVKDRLELVNNIRLSREKNKYSNSYKFPIEDNESSKTEALKCTKMAEEASQKGQYDRAEHLLLKSLRICYTKTATSNLELVRNAKAQNDKTTKLPPKNQADFMYTAENESKNKKIENPTNFPNTAEKFKPTPLVKDRLELVNDIRLTCEKNEYSNSYKFPIEDNESSETEALKCTKMAEEAYQKNQYDRAERLLLKSLEIRYSESTNSNLELVRKAKAQNYTNITVRTEKKYNEHCQNGQVNEYNKCTRLSSEAWDEGNLARAEHFLEKAIRINPNDSDKKRLNTIQAKKRVNEERLKREQEEEILKDLADGANRDKNYSIALYYIKLALKKQLNEKTHKQFQSLKAEIERQKRFFNYKRYSLSSQDKKSEAKKLLDQVSACLSTNNIEKAEFFLVLSWDLSKSQNTLLVSQQFVTARIEKHRKDKKNQNDGRNYKNIIESDELVESVLDILINNKFYETTKKKKNIIEIESNVQVLQAASELHSSILIDKLLNEIPTKRTDVPSIRTNCNVL